MLNAKHGIIIEKREEKKLENESLKNEQTHD